MPKICANICLVQDLKNTSTATQDWFAKDLLLTKTLLDCMGAVALGTEEELTALKKTFTAAASGKNSQSSGSQGGGKTIGALGSAPPTATIQDLVTLGTLRKFHKRVAIEVMEKDDYKALRAECVAGLAPLKDLMVVHKKRVSALDTRKAAWKNLKEQKYGDIASPTAAQINS